MEAVAPGRADSCLLPVSFLRAPLPTPHSVLIHRGKAPWACDRLGSRPPPGASFPLREAFTGSGRESVGAPWVWSPPPPPAPPVVPQPEDPPVVCEREAGAQSASQLLGWPFALWRV